MSFTMQRNARPLALIVVVAICTRAAAVPLSPIQKGNVAIRLVPIATGMAAPDYGINPPNDTGRLFVVEQNGLLRVIQSGALLPTPALDLQSRVQIAPVGNGPLNPSSANAETGFLGLAFHPDFFDSTKPGYRTLYTYSSEAVATNPLTFTIPVEPTQGGGVNNYVNVISEYKMTTPTSNVVDPASRRVILTIGKDQSNHNGGTIAFGPDNYLYLATGDGGAANDRGRGHLEPNGNAQVITGGNVLGKMLRIDPINPTLTSGPDAVSANGQYRIPDGNPFDAAGQVPEIYAYGFRNPYRYAFDRGTGDLIMADVGQNTIEEINKVTIGKNYGWPLKEGDFLFNRVNPGAGTVGARSPEPAGSNLVDPIKGTLGTLEYDHGDGISITGGFVYRGTAIPELVGKFVFGDLALHTNPVRADGRLFYADLTTGVINEFLLPQFAGGILPSGLTVHGFGQDGNNELYALVTNTPSNGTGGIVYKIVAVPEPATGLTALVISLVASAALRRRKLAVR